MPPFPVGIQQAGGRHWRSGCLSPLRHWPQFRLAWHFPSPAIGQGSLPSRDWLSDGAQTRPIIALAIWGCGLAGRCRPACRSLCQSAGRSRGRRGPVPHNLVRGIGHQRCRIAIAYCGKAVVAADACTDPRDNGRSGICGRCAQAADCADDCGSACANAREIRVKRKLTAESLYFAVSLN